MALVRFGKHSFVRIRIHCTLCCRRSLPKGVVGGERFYSVSDFSPTLLTLRAKRGAGEISKLCFVLCVPRVPPFPHRGYGQAKAQFRLWS